MIARVFAAVIAAVLVSSAPGSAQQQAPGVPGSVLPPDPPPSAPQGQQQPAQQKPERNGGAQQAPGADSQASRGETAIVNPSEAPHQSGSAKQGTENGKGENPNQGETGPSWRRFVEKLFEDPVAFFTVWVAVFTAVLASSTIGLWRQTRRLAEQAVEASRDTKRSIEIAETAAIETARAAQAAVDAVNMERAWVLPSNLSCETIADIDQVTEAPSPAVKIRFVWKNFGRGPAIELITGSSMSSQNWSETPTKALAHYIPTKTYNAISSGEKLEETVFILSAGAVLQILKKEYKWYLYIGADYKSRPDTRSAATTCALYEIEHATNTPLNCPIDQYRFQLVPVEAHNRST